MAGTHRVWSFFEDDSCSGAATGVFMQKLNDCPSQVASSGLKCAAQYLDGKVVGYADESCHDDRVATLHALYQGAPYLASDYYWDADCTDYENTVSSRLSDRCEIMFDGFSPVRSSKISVENGNLTWARNMGPMNTSLDCPGEAGPGYYPFNVSVEDINKGVCQHENTMKGGFVYYNTSADVSFGSTSTSTTIGLVCGGIIVLIMIIVLAYCLWKRNKQRKGTERSSMHYLQDPFLRRGSAWTGGSTQSSDPSTLESGLWRDSAIVANRVPRDQVNIGNLISRGGFGEIYKGTYNREAVAIKMLFPEMRGDLHKVNAFLAEVKLMAGLVHPHIVRFVGVSWGSLSDLCVLTELMKGGDLRELLKEYHANGHPQGIDQEKLRIAYHVAQALTYLHSLSPIVIHRDLKSKNVLLTENLDAKLTDFGVSREQQENTMTAGVGTMLWMAPEVMMAQRYDEKADIFSFGVLLSELDLQLLPYSHARYDSENGMKVPDTAILQKVSSGLLQVEFSGGCLASMVKLGRECVALDPRARPSSPMLIFRLQTIMKESIEATEQEATYIL